MNKGNYKKGFTLQKIRNFSGGFTLIELLVVIAIISLLSSVVLSSLNSARIKAKDTTIKASLNQMATLMTLNFTDYGDYCALQAGWVSATTVCEGAFSGSYATNARGICKVIYNNTNADPNYRLYTGQTQIGCATTYSFMVQLNNGNWYCIGSSGAKGEYPLYYYNRPGCWDTP